MVRSLEQVEHKLLIILCVNPGGADANADLRRGQVFGLHFFQFFHIYSKFQVCFSSGAGGFQFPAYISGEIFISCLPSFVPAVTFHIKGAAFWGFENNAL